MTENEFPTAPKWAESATDYKQTAAEFPNQCTQEVMNYHGKHSSWPINTALWLKMKELKIYHVY